MLTRLFVLGLLMQRPMSGYTIQTVLQLSQTQQWARVLPGSVYHALKKLADEGFVVLQATELAGNRSKAIYAVTLAGKDEFRKLLKEAWSTPVLHFPAELYAALSFLDDLPREEIVSAIDERIATLERELAIWNEGEIKKAEYMQGPYPDYLRALFANGREHMEVDLRFLRYLRQTIPSAPKIPVIPDITEEEIV
ncbi:MAG TPA: PadR family transcriptional regulator [Ktedonobacteraceae bacterium]